MNIHERKCHWFTRLVGMIFAISYGETLVMSRITSVKLLCTMVAAITSNYVIRVYFSMVGCHAFIDIVIVEQLAYRLS